MPAAVLNPDLLGDALVGVVDDIRREIRAALGTRPFRVAIITRTWSGGRRGSGTPSDVKLELDPPPMVTDLAVRNEMRPAGREEEGDLRLTEVSLRYAEAELHPNTGSAVEWAYRVTEAHGQQQRTRFFTVAKPPYVRRGDQAGDRTDWVVTLRLVEPWDPLPAP